MVQTTLDNTLGAIEVGSCFSIFLFGVLCVQVYIYYGVYRLQSTTLDAAVALVWCLDLGHTICIAHATYFAVITGFGHPEKIDELITVLSMPLVVLFSGLVEFIVRMVYIRRIQVFSGTCYVPALFYAMSTIVCLAAIFISVATFQAKTTSGFIRQWMWSYTATLSGIVVSDGLIAATLCYYLKKSELSLARSSKLIKKLMLWTIETSLLTSLTALAQLICFLTMQSSFIYISIYVTLPKLYSNSLLALLNGRTTLRNIPPSLSTLNDAGDPESILLD